MSTAMDMQKLDKERQTRLFERMIEAFLKEWMPEDHYMAMEFERGLHMLVRQIYRDAQEPLLEHMTKLSSAFQTFPLTLPNQPNPQTLPNAPANVR